MHIHLNCKMNCCEYEFHVLIHLGLIYSKFKPLKIHLFSFFSIKMASYTLLFSTWSWRYWPPTLVCRLQRKLPRDIKIEKSYTNINNVMWCGDKTSWSMKLIAYYFITCAVMFIIMITKILCSKCFLLGTCMLFTENKNVCL